MVDQNQTKLKSERWWIEKTNLQEQKPTNSQALPFVSCTRNVFNPIIPTKGFIFPPKERGSIIPTNNSHQRLYSHLRKGSVSRWRTLRGNPSGKSSPGGTSESSKFSRSPSTSSRSSVDLLQETSSQTSVALF